MPCPTCSATLAGLGEIDGRRHWHCGRCGTHVITSDTGPDHTTAPLLVSRCRLLVGEMPFDPKSRTFTLTERLWAMTGIRDCINTPENRR